MTKHVIVYEHLVGKRMSRHTTVLWAKTVEEAKKTATKGAEAKRLINFKILRVNTIWES